MQTFTIYPKDGGEEIKVQFRGFEFIDDRIVLHDYIGKESQRGYLKLDAIAAILAPQDLDAEPTDVEAVESLFLVYLKERKDPLKILAGYFDATHPDRVLFYRAYHDGRRAIRQPEPVEDIYVAKSEVVAIFPSTGLERKWRVDE